MRCPNHPPTTTWQVILRRTLQREIKRRAATGEDDMAFFDHKRAASMEEWQAGHFAGRWRCESWCLNPVVGCKLGPVFFLCVGGGGENQSWCILMPKCMLLLENFEGFRGQKVHCLAGLLHKNDVVFLESACLVLGFWFGLFHQHEHPHWCSYLRGCSLRMLVAHQDSYIFFWQKRRFFERGALVPICTLPETNSKSPLKIGHPRRKRESIPTIHFQVRTVSFREGK